MRQTEPSFFSLIHTETGVSESNNLVILIFYTSTIFKHKYFLFIPHKRKNRRYLLRYAKDRGFCNRIVHTVHPIAKPQGLTKYMGEYRRF